MDVIFEFLFDLIVEGSLELGATKKVPMAVRILVGFFLVVIYGGLIGLLMYAGVRNKQPILAIIGFGLLLLLAFIVYKYIKQK